MLHRRSLIAVLGTHFDEQMQESQLALESRRRGRSKKTTLDRHRVRQRILKPAIKLANGRLNEAGIEPIGEVGLHGLRRTYASLRFALRDDPVWVAEQLGHSQPDFSMTVYARATKRRERLEGRVLAAFDRALKWADLAGGSERFDRPPSIMEGRI
jgi:integrase